MLAQTALANNPALPKKSEIAFQQPQTYTFQSQPRALNQRTKYRENSEVNNNGQGKIARGNNYAGAQLPLSSNPDPVEIQKQIDMKKRARAKRRAEIQRRIKTPEAVIGRKHIDIQTDLYLEELSEKVPEAVAATQTDAFLDRAPSPLYIPQKSGLDVATQVYPGELFDFNYEVEPILEVLVAKTVEQALMEVMEEEELATLKKYQYNYEKRRNAELAEVQRLEDAERRRTEEKERRLNEQIRLAKEKQEAAEKIAARAFAQSYLSNLVPSVLDNLQNNGYFYDVVEKEIETNFLPWLTTNVEKNLDQIKLGRKLLDELIYDALYNNKNGNF